MVGAERGESLDVFVAGFAGGAGGDVVQGALGVDRVVEDDQAQPAELFFLALAVGLAQFAAVATADISARSVGPSETRRRARTALGCFRCAPRDHSPAAAQAQPRRPRETRGSAIIREALRRFLRAA